MASDEKWVRIFPNDQSNPTRWIKEIICNDEITKREKKFIKCKCNDESSISKYLFSNDLQTSVPHFVSVSNPHNYRIAVWYTQT